MKTTLLILATAQYIAYTLIGLCALAVSISSTMDTAAFIKSTHKAQGQVTTLIPKKQKKTCYSAIIQFSSPLGGPQTLTQKNCTNPASYAIGDYVEILYIPNELETAKINSFWDLWLTPLITLLIGVIMTLIGGNNLLQKIKKILLIRYLKRRGLYVKATVSDISYYKTIRNHYRWILTCYWVNPGDKIKATFKSQPLHLDPHKNFHLGAKVDLLVDPKDTKKYHMNL